MSLRGFDCDIFPGVPIMAEMWRAGYRVCSPYIPSPAHQDASWWESNVLDYLLTSGWMLAPTYVPATAAGDAMLSANLGTAQGTDCAQKLAAQGFKQGTFAYVDVEEPPLTMRLCAYLATFGVALGMGGYNMGVYCSHLMVSDVTDEFPTARIWAYQVPTVTETKISIGKLPALPILAAGWAGRQYMDNVLIEEFNLRTDQDVWAIDPSAP